MHHSVFTSSCVSPLLLFSSVAAAFGNAGQAGHARVTLAHNLNRAGVEVVLAEARGLRRQRRGPRLRLICRHWETTGSQPSGRRRRSRSSEPSQSDDDDLFLVPPAPAPSAKAKLGGELGRADGGRTEVGYWASLMDAPDRLRASDLNEVLQPDHLNRLLFANFPLQAYGALFKWDVLVRDPIEVYRRPWALVAAENDLPPPDDEDVMRAVGARAATPTSPALAPDAAWRILSGDTPPARHLACVLVAGMRPERAIQQTFRWTDDWGTTQRLTFEHFEKKADVLRTHTFEPADGALEWLTMLKEYEVPCCVCAGTALDRASAESALTRAGLHHLLDEYVTLEDGCETAEQSFLVSSIKLRRPPERCVVFADDREAVTSAHEAIWPRRLRPRRPAVLSSSLSAADLRQRAHMRVLRPRRALQPAWLMGDRRFTWDDAVPWRNASPVTISATISCSG